VQTTGQVAMVVASEVAGGEVHLAEVHAVEFHAAEKHAVAGYCSAATEEQDNLEGQDHAVEDLAAEVGVPGVLYIVQQMDYGDYSQ